MVEFDFKAYRRTFAKEYQTASDSVMKRSGILIRARDKDGRVGYGEAAPIESFGTESFVAALSLVSDLKGNIEYDEFEDRLRGYPCLRFGMESALEMLKDDFFERVVANPWPVSGLVPDLGDRFRLESLLEAGYRCLKLKIAKQPLAVEQRLLERIVGETSGEILIRLDANGGLDLESAKQWMSYLADLPIDYLEQPLPRGSEDLMRRLARDYPTALALDESVGSVDDLKRWRDQHWEGVFVIKPSLSGGYGELREELRTGNAEQLVFSSSLETLIGASAALSLAIEAGEGKRPLGFGVEALFADRDIGLFVGPFLQKDGLPDRDAMENLWNRI